MVAMDHYLGDAVREAVSALSELAAILRTDPEQRVPDAVQETPLTVSPRRRGGAFLSTTPRGLVAVGCSK